MDILNMNEHAVHPRVKGPDGKPDSVTVMPKRRVTLPEGYTVDINWLGSVERVSVFETKTSRVAVAKSGVSATQATVVANGAGVQLPVAISDPVAVQKTVQQVQQEALAAHQASMTAARESNSN